MSETGDRPPEGGDTGLKGVLRDWLRGRKRSDSARETLEELIEEREDAEQPIDAHERLLLANILKLRDVTAYDVMVPRADIVAVSTSVTLTEFLAIFSREGHSRMPVYRESLDDASGMVHIKDLLGVIGSDKPFSVARLQRRVLFVSPTMRVLDLLLEMRIRRMHMALVVDEYGGVDGLVTIEDLVEQIVGEIEDEHDTDEEPEIIESAPGLFEADARLPVERLEEKLGSLLDEDEREDIDTLGGLVFAHAGRVPARGEIITHPAGLEFEIIDADPRRIRRIKVRRLPGANGTDLTGTP